MKNLPAIMAMFFACAKAPAPEDPVHPEPPVKDDKVSYGLVMVGDTGTGEADQFKVAGAMRKYCAVTRCSAGLLLGDNFYPIGVRNAADPQFNSKFHIPYDPLGFNWYVALGNHDYMQSPQAQVDHKGSFWQLPARYYKVSVGNLDLFALDSNKDLKAQVPWLQRNLEASKAAWKVVFAHHPIRSYGVHGDEKAMAVFKGLLKKYEVDIFASGHDHDKQIIQEGALSPFYLVSGAGAKTRNTGFGPDSIFAASTLGFSHLAIYSDKLAKLFIVNGDGNVEFTLELHKP